MTPKSKNASKTFPDKIASIFKTYGYHIQEANKANIWNFISFNKDKSKKYAIYCIDDYKQVKSLIKVAIKQALKERMRLVVVTQKGHEDLNELELIQTDYCLTTLANMEEMGVAMIEALQNELPESERTLDYNQLESGKVIVK